MWDPGQYTRFDKARSRPFFDLLAQVDVEAPRQVVDLGCGTGALTALLAERWPKAEVLGIDSSPEMLDAAAEVAIPGRLQFELTDLAEFVPGPTTDVVLANASLQWVPGHLGFVEAVAGQLPPGGVLAFQVPGNFEAPSHRLLAELCASPHWRDVVGDAGERIGSHEPAEYLAALASAGLSVDAWETTYLHVLQGDDPVLEWMKGTALRPVLARLSPEDEAAFLAELGALLAAPYPRRPFGTLFPFRRIFVVALRR